MLPSPLKICRTPHFDLPERGLSFPPFATDERYGWRMKEPTEQRPLSSVKSLHIELGYPCNIRCIMCFQKNFTQRMDRRIWETV